MTELHWPAICPYCNEALRWEPAPDGLDLIHQDARVRFAHMEPTPGDLEYLDKYLARLCHDPRPAVLVVGELAGSQFELLGVSIEPRPAPAYGVHEGRLEPQASSPDDARGYRMGCKLSGPGRGDCEHFVGFLDGNPVDEYGIPLGWCDYCWQQALLSVAERAKREAEQAVDYWRGRWDQDTAGIRAERDLWERALNVAANERNNARLEAGAAKADGERWRQLALAVLAGPDGTTWRELVAEGNVMRDRLVQLQAMLSMRASIDIDFPDGKGYSKQVWPKDDDHGDKAPL